MKTLFLSLIVSLTCMYASAQTPYEQAMQNALEAFGKAATIDELVQTAAKFEQIAEVETKEWLPGYYASLIYCIVSFRMEDVEQKENYTNKAQQIADKLLILADNESEVHTLQGMIYQAVITVDPMKNGQIYSTKANGAFQTAMKLNPANPRPIYLQASSLMYTPEQYGGGKKAAQPLFAKALALFSSEAPQGDFYPVWGKDDCLKQLEACKSE